MCDVGQVHVRLGASILSRIRIGCVGSLGHHLCGTVTGFGARGPGKVNCLEILWLELCSLQCGLWSSIKVRGGLVGNADSQGPCPRLTELSPHFTKIPGDLSTTIWEKHEAERLRAVQRLTEHLVQNLGFRREAGAKHSGLFSRFYPERGQSVKNVLIRNPLVPQIANLSSRPRGR